MTNPVTYIFNERGKNVPRLEIKSKNPVMLLEDLIQDNTKSFIIMRLDALKIDGKLYDSFAGVTDNPIEVEYFYHVPLKTSCSGEAHDILAAAVSKFSETGYRRILVEYNHFKTLCLIDVTFDETNPGRVYMSSTSVLATNSQKLFANGKTGKELLNVLSDAPEEYRTSLIIQERSAQRK